MGRESGRRDGQTMPGVPAYSFIRESGRMGEAVQVIRRESDRHQDHRCCSGLLLSHLGGHAENRAPRGALRFHFAEFAAKLCIFLNPSIVCCIVAASKTAHSLY